MNLIALLICVGLERFFSLGIYAYRFNWYETYIHKISPLFHIRGITFPFLSLLVVIVPFILIFSVLLAVASHITHHFLSFMISNIILFYCLGPLDLFDKNTLPHQAVFWKANETFFSVMWWFQFFGPLGALIYRLIERASHMHHSQSQLAAEAVFLRSILDWLPVRIFSFVFVIMGHFKNTLKFWRAHVLSSCSYNRELIEKTGRIAIGLEENSYLRPQTYNDALSLIDRSLIFYLVVIVAILMGLLL